MTPPDNKNAQNSNLFSTVGPYPQWNEQQAKSLILSRFSDGFALDKLLQSLIVIQHHFGVISNAAEQWLAQQSQVTQAYLRSIIDFYGFLHRGDAATYHVLLPNNIIEQHNGINTVFTTCLNLLNNSGARVEYTSCIGLSDQPIAALINGYSVCGLSADDIKQMCQLICQQVPITQWPKHWFSINNLLHHKTLLPHQEYQPGIALEKCQSLSADNIIATVKQSGLRGLGGAGFPTATKWQRVAGHQTPIKYIVCNADEGEPGTFKDRYYLSEKTGQIIEGMIIAAKAVGACKGFLYLRGEYLSLMERIDQTLAGFRERGWLNPSFDIEVHLGAGAYVCGEESALLESLEGKRGIPRCRPPYPVDSGLFGQPTVINNVETLALASTLFQNGVESYLNHGTPSSTGIRIHSVSGDCTKPGLYELPQGATLKELLTLSGAIDPGFVQVGGPSGERIDITHADTPLDFEHPGHGGSIMIFSQHRNSLEITKNFAHFFRHESCGFCTPCRAGTQAIMNIMEQMDSAPNPRKVNDLIELANVVATTSHCGLGKTAGTNILNHFKHSEDCNDR